uniref:Uncharacterized protein n=1 Tax=Arundo donax TaxID=35708 RepID=A0A0A8ZST3_ARUDO
MFYHYHLPCYCIYNLPWTIPDRTDEGSTLGCVMHNAEIVCTMNSFHYMD